MTALIEGLESPVTIRDDGYYTADRELTRDEIDTALSRAGRVNGPAMLFDLAINWVNLEDPEMTGLVAAVWSMAEYPERAYDDPALWVEFFEDNGYNGTRPDAPITLYRGSTPEGRQGMSWTSDRAVAERFAGGIRGREAGHLYTATVDPAHLLAFITDRDESEYVVNPDGLTTITEL